MLRRFLVLNTVMPIVVYGGAAAATLPHMFGAIDQVREIVVSTLMESPMLSPLINRIALVLAGG